jgi:ketosteroid isomerase-like protein
MSDSPNVELVRSIYADWERGDYSSADWADPNIEFVFVDGPSPGRWIGRGGMATANRDWLSAWKGVRQTVDETRELDGERVLVLHQYRASGRVSGLHTDRSERRRRPCSKSIKARL